MKTHRKIYRNKEDALDFQDELRQFNIKAEVIKKVYKRKGLYWEVKWRQ